MKKLTSVAAMSACLIILMPNQAFAEVVKISCKADQSTFRGGPSNILDYFDIDDENRTLHYRNGSFEVEIPGRDEAGTEYSFDAFDVDHIQFREEYDRDAPRTTLIDRRDGTFHVKQYEKNGYDVAYFKYGRCHKVENTDRAF